MLGLIEADVADKTFHTVLGLASLGSGLASGGARGGQREDPQPAS